MCAAVLVSGSLPSSFQVSKGNGLVINSHLPVTAVKPQNGIKKADSKYGKNSYDADLKLFGMIPIKSVTVTEVARTDVLVCGKVCGLELFTDGVIVVGMMSVDSPDGKVNPGREAGIEEGDVILAINGKTVSTNAGASAIIAGSGGKQLTISLKRGNTGLEVRFTPVKSQSDGRYKAGLWIRDSSAGIGTLTFIDPSNGVFAGLGHAVCDIDTGNILPVLHGSLTDAGIDGVIPSTATRTGQIQGHFIGDNILGKITLNSDGGIYGKYLGTTCNYKKKLSVAMKQQVHEGSAQILAMLGTKPEYYDCVIKSVDYSENNSNQDMTVEVTDKRLIAKTGGIVQGMSGSPLIQDGMLAGAVTHVFVGDPRMGYAIFAQTMLKTAETAGNSLKKTA